MIDTQEPTVYLRMYATEPYLQRAALVDPEARPFSDAWVHGKYYPRAEDGLGGDPVGQGQHVARQMAFAREELKVGASGGYVLHPIDWLSFEHWQQRAEALESFIVSAGISGEIALDIEGYGYPDVEGKTIRVGPPAAEDWQELIRAAAPIRYVLLKHKLRATVYPAGGRKFEHYTRAALALGASAFGDEYSFVFAEKLKRNELDNASIRFFLAYFAEPDPDAIGVGRVPALFTSTMRGNDGGRALLKLMGIKACWLFVDDKNWLK